MISSGQKFRDGGGGRIIDLCTGKLVAAVNVDVVTAREAVRIMDAFLSALEAEFGHKSE